MNKEEAIEQLYRLSLDWEENGLDTKLNQTDINAIKIIVSELDIANKKYEDLSYNKEFDNILHYRSLENELGQANKKLDKIKELVNKYGYYTLSEIPELLSKIGGE